MNTSEKQINIAVISAGGRSVGVVNNLLKESKAIKISTLFDPDMNNAKSAVESWKQTDIKISSSYQEAIQRDDVDWVMVFSPNAFHKEHILCAFEANKHVFSEKPLATTIEDCEEIFKAHEKLNLIFATGFVLRYSPLYKKTYEIINSGHIGKLISIDANENVSPGHGGYIMRNWRRFKELSGPHILEKCCHDLDLINWFTNSVPSRIAAFGGLDFFTPENQHLNEIKTDDGKDLFSSWPTTQACEESPFFSKKDIRDNQVAIMEYRNGIRVMFQATMSNAIPERRMYFSGTEGTIISELYSGICKCKRIDEKEETIYDFSEGDGHGGGDDFIMKELYNTMLTGTPPICSGVEGLESAVVALAIDKANDDGVVFDLEPIWKNLKR